MTGRGWRLGAALVLVAACAGALVAAEPDTLRGDVDHLTSPKLEGRLTGTAGAKQAADYLARRLEQLGARPLPGAKDFRLGYDFQAGVRDQGSTLTLTDADGKRLARFKGDGEVTALSFSESGSAAGPVVFAGYGLTLAGREGYGYDNFAGLDVKDKLVLVLNGFPQDVDEAARRAMSRQAGLRDKARLARELGARALLVVNGPRSPQAGQTLPLSFDASLDGAGVVAASVGGEVADAIFARVEGQSLERLQAGLDDGNPHVRGFEVPGLTLSVETKIKRERREAVNVVGYLPATLESAGAPGYVLLGAHYDHLGRGEYGKSMAAAEARGSVHPGADDNASGVAAVLDAAAQLAGASRQRAVMLGFWSGEELGLIGSTAFLGSGVVGPSEIVAYVNFDTVGRVKDNRLVLEAAGSSSVWRRLVEQANVVVGFDLVLEDDPYLPTDALAFYEAEVPALSLFGGAHGDYHGPQDTADKLDYDELGRVAQLGALLARKLGALPERPDYQQVARRQETESRGSGRPFTGTVPDYTADVEGLLLGGVIEGGPAAAAGLREGDVIVEFGGRAITNVYDYSFALDSVKVGQSLKVVYVRDGQRHETEITPTARE